MRALSRLADGTVRRTANFYRLSSAGRIAAVLTDSNLPKPANFGLAFKLAFVKESREFLSRAGVLIWNVGKVGEATLEACADGANGGGRFLKELEHTVRCGAQQVPAVRNPGRFPEWAAAGGNWAAARRPARR